MVVFYSFLNIVFNIVGRIVGKNLVKFRILLLFTAIFIIGCTSCKQVPSFHYIPWQTRRAELQNYEHWYMSGVISITKQKILAGVVTNTRESLSFKWQHTANNQLIDLFGPLGIGNVQINASKYRVTLCQAGQSCISAQSAEQLFFQLFGWHIPISNIKYWALGLMAPENAQSVKFDKYGRLIAIKQLGWYINYLEFKRYNKIIDLPNVIELKKTDTSVKIKVKNFVIK